MDILLHILLIVIKWFILSRVALLGIDLMKIILYHAKDIPNVDPWEVGGLINLAAFLSIVVAVGMWIYVFLP